MEQFNIRQYLDYNLFTLKLIGLYTDGPLFKTQFYWKYTIFVHICAIGSLSLVQFIYLVENRHNLELFAICFSSFAITLLENIKAFFHLQNEKLIKKLMGLVQLDEFQPKNAKQRDEARSVLNFYVVTYFGFSAMTVSVAILWLVIPILFKGTRDLPMLAWYPFDWRKQFYYEFSYVHQIVSLIYTALTLVNIDMVIAGLMSCIAVECDILSDTFENLHDFTASELGGNSNRITILENMNSSLIKNVAHHLKILEFSKETGHYLNFIMIAQFAASLAALCMLTFQLTFLSPSSLDFVEVLCFQVAVFGELFIYTWFGNEIIHKSNQIPLALYKMGWLDCSEKFKRNLIFVIMRCQKPIELYAVNFFMISVPTFVAILRISWSAFAVLRRVHEGK